MSVLRDILLYRYLFDAIIFVVWIISVIMTFDSCEMSSASIKEATGHLGSTNCVWAMVELGWTAKFKDSSTTMLESLTRNLPTRSKVIVGWIIFSIPTLFNRLFNGRSESMIARLLWYVRQMLSTLINRFFGGDPQQSMIDPTHDNARESPRCAAIDRLLRSIPQMILTVIATDLVMFLSGYAIDCWKSRQAQRRLSNHRSTNWFHQLRVGSDRQWHHHQELIQFMSEYAGGRSPSNSRASHCISVMPVINLNSKSDENNIDRLVYSMIIFNCGICDSDNGIYLFIISEFLRKYRVIKISSTLPAYGASGGARIWAYVHDRLVMFEIKHTEHERTQLLFYNIEDDSKRQFDASSMPEFDRAWRFWYLKDDGRDLGREIKKDATYVRVIYVYIPPADGFAFRQCLLEIPSDGGEITVKRLQEIKYGSNWKFTKHYRLIRTSRDEIGIIGELVDWDVTTEDDGDGARWTTCVVYSPETRRLSAVGDYEKYLEIDPGLRQYFDRRSTRSRKPASLIRFRQLFLCPEVLTNARAIDIRGDGSLKRIDFEPRSLKWQSLRKLFDGDGEIDYDQFRAADWRKLTGVEMDKHFWG